MKEQQRNNNVTWKDKLRSKYVWQKKRKFIRQRDNECCVICKSTYQLNVHHIVPMEKNRKIWLDDNNLITLCKFCHEKAERGEIPAATLKEKIPPGVDTLII